LHARLIFTPLFDIDAIITPFHFAIFIDCHITLRLLSLAIIFDITLTPCFHYYFISWAISFATLLIIDFITPLLLSPFHFHFSPPLIFSLLPLFWYYWYIIDITPLLTLLLRHYYYYYWLLFSLQIISFHYYYWPLYIYYIIIDIFDIATLILLFSHYCWCWLFSLLLFIIDWY
jgi:hypothetical protein